MKKINNISILLLLVSSFSYGQMSLGRQVIGSTGGFASGTNFTVSSTVGEAVVQTLFSTNLILTQGFQQTLKPNDSIVNIEVINEACPGAANGSIYVNNIIGCPGPYSIIVKSVNDTTVQIAPDTLSTGNYIVVITGLNGCVYPTTIFVGLDSDEDCLLKFYTGITPNGDGKNDVWIIENIDMFPENSVKIFNRWGNQVWSAENYNNDDIIWDGLNEFGGDLSDATYFYVAEVNKKIFKGWVELTR